MRTIIIISFLLSSYFGNTQLIDPFGKVATHEIKLTKLDDGTYMGAMEWTTGGIDSLQRFVVQNLNLKAPVMVRIISKAPDHNIDLSFHKKKWSKVESKVSTNGEKFVDKIFRTMGTAGIGVSSKVAGIPYLITVKVGLQFPSTKSLIRITDDIEEYNSHLRNIGIATITEDKNIASSNNAGIGGTISKNNNNSLMYVIIGLLSLIILLLGLFLVRKKKSKTTLVLWFFMCLSAYSIAQSNVPKPVPVDGQGESPVFFNYGTSNVANQNPVPITTIMNSQDVDVISFNTDGSPSTRSVRININPGASELSGKDAAEVLRRIKEANEEFDREYRENMPGEPIEADQRIPPSNQTREELEQLRRQVRQLQQQVDRLSQEDEEYEEGENEEARIVIFCDDISACMNCYIKAQRKLTEKDAYFQVLQSFYAMQKKSIDDQIALGNAWSNVHGVSAIVWQSILHNKIMPSVRTLNNAYKNKFDEYIADMRKILLEMESCHTSQNPGGRQTKAIKQQAKALVDYYSRTKITEH